MSNVCNYVVLCHNGKPSGIDKLSKSTQALLRVGLQVWNVDPCVLRAAHTGEHVLSTMSYAGREHELADVYK